VRIKSILLPYLDVEVERLVTNIVNKTINDEMKNINIDKNDFYNMSKLSELENRIDGVIEEKLINIDDGEVDDYFLPKRIKNSRFKSIKNGVLCDVSIGSIRGSTVFSNVGPTIPVKLLFSSGTSSNIDVEVSEYGINSAIIKIYLNIEISEQITMPITSKHKKINIKKPLIIDIIKGEIPDYYTGLIK
jgi:sporulation protein YunB